MPYPPCLLTYVLLAGGRGLLLVGEEQAEVAKHALRRARIEPIERCSVDGRLALGFEPDDLVAAERVILKALTE